MSTATDIPVARTAECKVVPKQNTYLPAFDLWRSDDRVILQGDVPGVAPGDLEVSFEEGTLKLRAKIVPRLPREGVLRREYGVGNYERYFSIGDNIDVERISATLRDGVVTIELPIVAKAQPRRIEIHSA